jgi:cyanate permease
MLASFALPRSSSAWRQLLLSLVIRITRLVLVGILFGMVYAWAAPKLYPEQSVPGFWLGSAHGACMPLALPSLLMHKDVPIYAEKNQGRIYKLGYIAGINACGFVFFGLAFWNPKGRTAAPASGCSRQ